MTKEDDVKAEVENTLQNKLAEKMMGIFELVVSDRSEHFAKNPDKIPDKKSVPSIISRSRKGLNMVYLALTKGL